MSAQNGHRFGHNFSSACSAYFKILENISFWAPSKNTRISYVTTMMSTTMWWHSLSNTIRQAPRVATPLWGKCEHETHTPKSGNLESFGTPATSKLHCRGQNTLPWSVPYTVEKALKFRCRKWSRMSHLNICNTSYGRKNGRESNYQFDSQPQKVGNQPDPGVCRWSATHCWKALEESYKFSSDLIPIRRLSQELWAPKVSGV